MSSEPAWRYTKIVRAYDPGMGDATRLEVTEGVTGWLSEVAVHVGGGEITCWVASSDGLRTFAHPELAFAVRAVPQLDRAGAANVFAGMLGALARAAASGQRVTTGGMTRFGRPVFGFDGVVYMPSQSIAALHFPDTTLLGVFASADELTCVERFGARRLACLLARQTGYYPMPPWSDPGRPRFPLASWPSVLAEMPVVRLAGASVVKADGLHLRLSRARCAPILHAVMPQLGDTPPTFVMHEVHPQADACLVWDPSQQEPSAVAPPGSRGERLGGCFLAFANEQPDNASQLVEDGFAYFLRDADYARVRSAWLSGEDVTIRGTASGDDLIVTWADDAAASAPAVTGGPVRVAGVQLLVEPESSSVPEVAAYIRALEATAARTLPVVAEPYEVLARIWVSPGEPPQIQFATRPFAPPADALEASLAALHAVAAPRTSTRFGFELHLAVAAQGRG
jgi:hypothetical protein